MGPSFLYSGYHLFDLGRVQGHMLELSGRRNRSTRIFDFWLYVSPAAGPTPTVKGSGAAKSDLEAPEQEAGRQDRMGQDRKGWDGTGFLQGHSRKRSNRNQNHEVSPCMTVMQGELVGLGVCLGRDEADGPPSLGACLTSWC